MEKVNNSLMKTSLYERHLSLNAKMLDFANFLMPISYNEGIKFEYNAVRNDVGIFDVSHMGIIKVSGVNSNKYLNHILSNDILKLQNEKALYSLMCNEKGGIIDDLIVYSIDDYFILIVNASNKEKDFNWMLNYKPNDVIVNDISTSTSLVAVQGPNSKIKLESLFDFNLDDLSFYSCKKNRYNDNDIFIARTGYTGELGYEILGDSNTINSIWDSAISNGCSPSGLAVRDVLRTEMGYCLYGHEINEEINPINAGLNWIIKKNHPFIGKDQIFETRNHNKKIIFIKMLERGMLREGCKILYQDDEIGFVTSGTFSYILNCGIGIGFVKQEIDISDNLLVTIRDKKYKIEISEKPFIKNRSLRDN